MITPVVNDKFHQLILEDRRIAAKSITEQLGNLRERVVPIIHENLDMRKLSGKLVPKYLNADEVHHSCQSSEQHLEFFQLCDFEKISCRDW